MRLFNKITLQTPESVELEFTLAGIGNRAYALLIDYIIWSLTLLLFLILAVFLFFQLSRINDRAENTLITWYWAIQFLIGFVIYVGYFVFFETIWQGQTPGKRFVKIRVIRDDARPIGLQQATLRALLRPFDDLFFIGVLFVTFNKLEKRIGDWVAGTVVIQDEVAIAKADFSISNEAQSLADRLKTEADIDRLQPEDFITIRDYLQRREEMISKARIELAKKLAECTREIIAWENIPEGTTPTLFLEAVYLAYQQK